ncbi:hypothetical protein HRTV-10_gp44 [Halorubrum tailed virus 10]|uniref:Uncharacterized protein n=1 Tax=Halorubrum tailed virus 10 TaxID=2877991 RepID=A0AAE9BV99_9CAUD|nr:hypothetical protein M1M36_gp088 [Halorubrum tailed virus 10]UBF19628.1 hypothetical protein HRTV-10_gp44 [Halorubrum tailed virus 10]UBF20000.1 hypothetical protein HRTV-22_gp45 [Halorubrum virus HRTV-22]UBF20126.1 hypothetical protein HRTV-26_gp45 [Halorubrum virus HRTV-26]UFK26319.1 hypothetical protein [Hardygib1 virus]
MNWRKILLALAVVSTIALAGCVAEQPEESPIKADASDATEVYEDNQKSVDRFIDREAGVVCYASVAYDGGGLSCVPISETNFGNR